ncbi:MAG: hypothetical protein E7203_13200 [Selenomonas ruminantium]|jgi:hypothetical protein|uniref:Uncharacterized protein n=1 Tax=Selenomonas ruminantium TaxID=971 RepID=A0A927ZWC6_SELRU|nr:hypothetical protein [Selenomonas ruminantium]MBE6086370.1 hypothetical protein [Selenomonas ruminantium]
MSEPIQTGHRVFQGNHKMNMEMLEMKPFYVATPGSKLTQEEMEAEAMAGVKKPAPLPPTVEESAPAEGSPEDIAARIAGDRTKNQADILELAKSQVDS